MIIAGPIIVQNLLSAAIGIVDTIMINYIGQNELAAISLANQPQFVLTLFYMGITSGTAIMIAQYLGAKNKAAVNFIFQLSLLFMVGVSFVFTVLTSLVPEVIISIFTTDVTLIALGKEYLQIVGISYVMTAFSQIYLVLLKTMQKVKKSAIISIITLVLNVVLNAIFIWGLFGMPKLGVFGVAIATVIARIIEFCICVLDYKRNRYISMRREKNTRLTRGYVKITGPIMLQGLIWGSAMATFSGIMGRMGADVVAAYSVAAVIQNIATVASFGIAEAGSILLGNELGGGELQKAKSDSKKMLFLTVSCGIIGCILMLLLEQPINLFLNFTPQAKYYFGIMYKILSINVVFASITYTSLNGIFTAGGDTRFPLYLDIIIMWGCCVLGGSIAAFIYQLSPICVFIILNLDELLKTPIVLARYKKDKWCINITKKEKRL